MKPGRSARDDLQRLRRCAGRRQHGERIGLGIKGIDFAVALTNAAQPDGFAARAARRQRR